MATDDDFEPRLGRQRAQGSKRARAYLSRVLAATNLARAAARHGPAARAFSGSRIGRGAGVGRLLASRDARAAFHQRRVIVKASIVKLAGKGIGAAAAHLRYLQRDGTTRDGAPGALYGRETDRVEASAFRERGAGDRHQFRFIVSAEDGAQYDDLKPLTRRLMARIEEDLGTSLDWVAVDHFNTGHPHTHIIVRGVDERGKDLIIARDYLTSGIRERAAELVDLDLGPRTIREVEAGLRAEIEQERLTSIDRALVRGLGADRLVEVAANNAFDQALRAGRLAKLARLGLAEPVATGHFRLAEDVEETLRRMGERGDIIRTMQRAFADRALDRPAAELSIYEPAESKAGPLVGRVVTRGLADEHADRHYVIVDGVDGRSHYIAIGKGGDLDSVANGAVVRIAPLRQSIREVDRTIAAVAAANDGRYDIDAHLRHDLAATETFAESHVRRLEAMRRAGAGVTRNAAGTWTIASDHLDRVASWEKEMLRERPVAVVILSAQPLDRLVGADGATWLDRELVAAAPAPLRDSGFGRDVHLAQMRRRQWLLDKGFAEEIDGVTRYQPGLLAALQRRELVRVASQLSEELNLPFAGDAAVGRIEGIYRRPVDLVSGRFALIERSRDFTLAPWRPVLESRIDKPVAGIVRGERISWSFGRGRDGPGIG